MGAPKGNEFWRIRTKHGKEKKYTPEKLLDGANDYFKWCEDNPLEREDYKGKDADRVLYEMPRPFTLEGLCTYLEIVTNTFKDYEKQKDYSTVCTRIRQIIRAQKFEGAAVGIFNHAIIARDLGLADKKEHNFKNKIKVGYSSDSD